ncbi:MAG: ATP-binding protein [Mycobacteriales bacterium]
MRTLSAGSLILAVTLVVSGASGGSTASAWVVGISLLGLVGIALYGLAFLAPAFVRVLWRQGDLTELGRAERGLMRALTREEVAATIVPVLAGLLGGSGAALLDENGRAIHTSGHVDLDGNDWTTRREDDGQGAVHRVGPGLFMAQMARGCLVVETGRLAPVFGTDESHLLSRVGTLVELALTRVAMFDLERQSRAAAEAANAELETLVYSVSHDLRSPLISVLGYLDLLRSEHEAELSEGGSHYLDRISVNGLYMQSLIADLLELSRIGREGPEDELVDLEALALDVVEAAGRGGIEVRVEVDPTVQQIRLNSVRARQLLTNLVDNALKYGGRADLEVVVSVKRGTAGEVLLAVSDNGRGIPAEYRERVLRVFERLDAPKSSAGTGIGLAICKRIAESLGGSLAMKGPAPGIDTGTTALVTLPASVLVATSPLLIPRKARDWVSTSAPTEGT